MSESENKTGSNVADGLKNLLAAMTQNKAVLVIVAVVIVLLFVLGIGVGSCSSKGSKLKAGTEVAAQDNSTSAEDSAKNEDAAADAALTKEVEEAKKAVVAGCYSIVTGQKMEKTSSESAPNSNPISEFRYKVCDTKTGLYVQYVGTSNRIIFPKEIEGIPVVEVGMRFSAGDKTIFIPEGVEIIAGMGNVSIVEIDIPTTVKVIRDEAFISCKIKGDFIIPSDCKIGEYVFQKASISKVVWPFVTVPKGTFYQSPTLEFIKFGDSTKVIEGLAVRACPALTSVDFPTALSSMGVSAFRENYKLTSLKGLDFCSKFVKGDSSYRNDASGNASITASEDRYDGGYQFTDSNALPVAVQNKLRSIGYTDPFVWRTSK